MGRQLPIEAVSCLHCRTGFDNDDLTAMKIATKNHRYHCAIEIIPIIHVPYIGVVFSFIGSLSLDHYQFLFLDDFEGNTDISVAVNSITAVTGARFLFWSCLTSPT